jgi:hypothetical protein
MKDLLQWCADAMRTCAKALGLFLLFIFALLGLYSASNFALQLNREKCVSVNDTISFCIIDKVVDVTADNLMKKL